MKKFRACVIGVGFIGAAHIEALRRLGNVEVVVGELAPLLLGGTLHLLPLAGNDVFVHCMLLILRRRADHVDRRKDSGVRIIWWE